jgi:hypothetical protein
MMQRKASIVLGAVMVVIPAVLFVESASAQRLRFDVQDQPGFDIAGSNAVAARRRDNQNLLLQFNERRPSRLLDTRPIAGTGATSRPSNRGMRGMPSTGGRGMRGGRMSGGMRRR